MHRKKSFEPLVIVEDDGLISPEVGPWAEDKYALVSLYDSLFSTGMKKKWDRRVYVDLYSGAGYNRLQGRSTVIAGSPVLALRVKDPFDKYVFCEKDQKKLSALQTRVRRIAPAANVSLINGDCNDLVGEISAAIPRSSLALCFVDPYDIGIKHSTLQQLARDHRMDFLVLLALDMDANRNAGIYSHHDATRIDEFLGNPDWRAQWESARQDRIPFTKFLANEFSKSMMKLAYLSTPKYKMRPIQRQGKSRLYDLALFSRSTTAYGYWDQVLKYSSRQKSFEFD